MKYRILLILSVKLITDASAQEDYSIRTIAFYNVENLFDIKNDSLVRDDERTPDGNYNWTKERYQKKVEHIAKVLEKVGQETSKRVPDIIGLCEIENSQVLVDLVSHPQLKKYKYAFIHKDSPDERGIDVALLYRTQTFLPTSIAFLPLWLFDDLGYRDYTRDQLVVSGILEDMPLTLLVNHWPSRSGGELRSEPFRIAAAKRSKRTIDSLRRASPNAKIISMGDFNDDPMDASFKKVLQTQGNRKNLDSTGLYNPFEKLYRKGVGSLAYRDQWNLFDQMILTSSLLADQENYFFWKAGVFKPSWLQTNEGRFKGYPFRTYVGTTYMGGYSDHFPVYLFLLKKQNQESRLPQPSAPRNSAKY